MTEFAPFDVFNDKEHPWSPLNLAKETTQVAKMFTQVPLQRKDAVKFDIFSEVEAEKSLSKGFRYRTWKLNSAKGASKPLKVVARTEVDSYLSSQESGNQFVHIRSLTEHFPIDPKSNAPVQNYVSWTTKFSKNQRGAIFASEMKNNAYVWGRWCMEAILSGVDFLKIGFFTRVGGARGYLSAGKNQLASQSFAAEDGQVKDGGFLTDT